MIDSSKDEKPVVTRRSKSLCRKTVNFQKETARYYCPKICAVCGRKANGYHYEAPTCCGCKAFFRRIVLAQVFYTCDREGSCVITSENRVFCRSCRFEKCVAVGMNPQGIRTDDNLEANPVVQRIAVRKSSEASTSRDTLPVYFSPSKGLEVSGLIDTLLNFELDKKIGGKQRRDVGKRLEVTKKTKDFKFLQEYLAISKIHADNDLKDSFDFITRHPVFSPQDKKDQSALLNQEILPLFNFQQAFSFFERKDDSVDSSNPIRKVIERSLIDPIERIDMKRKEHVLLKALLLCQADLSTLSNESKAALEEHKLALARALFSHCLTEDESGPSRFVNLLSVMNTVIDLTALQKDMLFYLKMTVPVKEEPIDPDY